MILLPIVYLGYLALGGFQLPATLAGKQEAPMPAHDAICHIG